MKIVNIVGARPNFMKIAQIMKEMELAPDIEPVLVHTGQHYDKALSELFFEELHIPKPDIDLGVGSGSHAAQTAEIMKRFEPVLLEHKPDIVLVVGDVNSTIACSLVASKLGIKIAHVEAGLRSFDRSMPEEINRVLTDSISDYMFTTERGAEKNLIREGISPDKIYFVGNVMIDTLMQHRKSAENSPILKTLGLNAGEYAILTLHRPGNVDNRETLTMLINSISEIAKKLPVLFPCHPRTQERIRSFGLYPSKQSSGITLTEPLGYLDFLKLTSNAKMVLTDSGGIQEETTVLGIPCLTLRENTERPITITEGTNILVGMDMDKLAKEADAILAGKGKTGKIPEKWDGKAAVRIVEILRRVGL